MTFHNAIEIFTPPFANDETPCNNYHSTNDIHKEWNGINKCKPYKNFGNNYNYHKNH